MKASLSGAFGGVSLPTTRIIHQLKHLVGLLATAIIKMDGIGGLAGWRWIFILEGITTIIFGLIAAIFLPADIASAKFLTEEERVFACMCYTCLLPKLVSLNW